MRLDIASCSGCVGSGNGGSSVSYRDRATHANRLAIVTNECSFISADARFTFANVYAPDAPDPLLTVTHYCYLTTVTNYR